MHRIDERLHVAFHYHGIIACTGVHTVGGGIVEVFLEAAHAFQIVEISVFVGDVHEHHDGGGKHIKPIALEEVKREEEASLHKTFDYSHRVERERFIVVFFGLVFAIFAFLLQESL